VLMPLTEFVGGEQGASARRASGTAPAPPIAENRVPAPANVSQKTVPVPPIAALQLERLTTVSKGLPAPTHLPLAQSHSLPPSVESSADDSAARVATAEAAMSLVSTAPSLPTKERDLPMPSAVPLPASDVDVLPSATARRQASGAPFELDDDDTQGAQGTATRSAPHSSLSFPQDYKPSYRSITSAAVGHPSTAPPRAPAEDLFDMEDERGDSDGADEIRDEPKRLAVGSKLRLPADREQPTGEDDSYNFELPGDASQAQPALSALDTTAKNGAMTKAPEPLSKRTFLAPLGSAAPLRRVGSDDSGSILLPDASLPGHVVLRIPEVDPMIAARTQNSTAATTAPLQQPVQGPELSLGAEFGAAFITDSVAEGDETEQLSLGDAASVSDYF
jgi:hypothetical protein